MIESDNDRVAYQTIRENILSLKYQPGHQIKEMPLAKTLKLTRTPIRKAIIRLANEGLVETFPNKGAFVTTLSKVEIDEIFEVREALELKAFHLAIRRACRDELDRIQHGIEESIQTFRLKEEEGYYPFNMDFHHEIIKLSKNNTLISIWEGLQIKLHRFRIRSGMMRGRTLNALKEHQEILICIYKNKPNDTERLLLQHMNKAKKVFSAVSK